ncbi:hypothetical protein P691DRAFT_806578 [Macrolepiota fuliginosa MF-IS2]|uniref:Uncharacterized protein n=1 Tax=Macrolepiota fuliginosa MF-IS2 TaxID=1400762 RepID=A0A9P6BZ14_9AGAR|nr:hypothetical protein P691DRAFT_806578 [Macrolepiota fuliginosa MF-IS2]
MVLLAAFPTAISARPGLATPSADRAGSPGVSAVKDVSYKRMYSRNNLGCQETVAMDSSGKSLKERSSWYITTWNRSSLGCLTILTRYNVQKSSPNSTLAWRSSINDSKTIGTRFTKSGSSTSRRCGDFGQD